MGLSLSIPVLNRFDLLLSCLKSIDTPIDYVHIIDNSSDAGAMAAVATVLDQHPFVLDWWVTAPPQNMGVAASWNYAIKQRAADPFWLIANADTEFGAGDLARLAQATAEASEFAQPAWIGMNGDWRVFGINHEMIQRVGWFDENYHPIYCEDADYEYRCRLADVPYFYLEGTTQHVGSAGFRSEDRYVRANGRTYPANVAYYVAKWGGAPRQGERFASPFDAGHPVGYWELRPSRLASQRWY